jgi:hypothetical protein
MIRTFSIAILVCLLSSFQEIKLVKTKVNESITLLLPEGFTPMDQVELNRKYVSTKPPVAAYSDYSKEMDLGVNIAYSRWNQEDLEIMKSFYKSNIMGLYSEVQFITESVQEINGRDFVVFEFVGSVVDSEGTSFNEGAINKFIRIQYTIVQGKTVLFNFSCPERVKEKWMPVANQIMESVKISKTL